MRLIDAESVPMKTVRSPLFSGGAVVVEVADIGAAPTVCCEECARWQAHEPPNTSGWGTCRDTHAIIEGKGRLFTPPDFGCSYFERRQP